MHLGENFYSIVILCGRGYSRRVESESFILNNVSLNCIQNKYTVICNRAFHGG